MSNVIINDWDSIETLKVIYSVSLMKLVCKKKMNVIQKLILL